MKNLYNTPLPPVLPDDEINKLAREGDTNAIVEHNLRLVISIAKHYAGILPEEDLIQEGNLGLIEAARRFDPDRGTPFVAYAKYWIRKYILLAIQRDCHIVQLSDYANDYAIKISRAMEELRQTLSREPSEQEIAAYTDIPDDMVRQLIVIQDTMPLDDDIDTTGGRNPVSEVEELIFQDEVMDVVMTELDQVEREVLLARCGFDTGGPVPYEELAKKYGKTTRWVHLKRETAIEKIKRLMNN